MPPSFDEAGFVHMYNVHSLPRCYSKALALIIPEPDDPDKLQPTTGYRQIVFARYKIVTKRLTNYTTLSLEALGAPSA